VGATNVPTAAVYPGSSPLLLRRVLIDVAGTETWLRQAHVGSITYEVWDRDTGLQVGTTQTLDPAVVVYDTPQTGTTWTDSLGPLGGNFELRLDGSFLPDAGKRYTVIVAVTLTGMTTFSFAFDLRTVKPRG
jgi:hypothetical protein